MTPQNWPTISTERCVGEPLSARHRQGFTALYQDPQVLKSLIGPDMSLSEDAIEQVLTRLVGHWEAHGFGPYGFCMKSDQSFVGYAGLRHTIADGRAEVELLYAIRADLWGKGLCTELAHPTVAQGFSDLNLKEIASFTLPENTASQRVLTKLGFQAEGSGIYGGVPHNFYRASSSALSAGTSP